MKLIMVISILIMEVVMILIELISILIVEVVMVYDDINIHYRGSGYINYENINNIEYCSSDKIIMVISILILEVEMIFLMVI